MSTYTDVNNGNRDLAEGHSNYAIYVIYFAPLRVADFLFLCGSSSGGVAGTRLGLANNINSQPALHFPPARSSFNAVPLTCSLRSTGT